MAKGICGASVQQQIHDFGLWRMLRKSCLFRQGCGKGGFDHVITLLRVKILHKTFSPFNLHNPGNSSCLSSTDNETCRMQTQQTENKHLILIVTVNCALGLCGCVTPHNSELIKIRQK